MIAHEIILCANPSCDNVVMQCRCYLETKPKSRGRDLCEDCTRRKLLQADIDYGNEAEGCKGRL